MVEISYSIQPSLEDSDQIEQLRIRAQAKFVALDHTMLSQLAMKACSVEMCSGYSTDRLHIQISFLFHITTLILKQEHTQFCY